MTDDMRIVAAAVRFNGLIFSVRRPGRHGDIIRELDALGLDAALIAGPGCQGFLTNTGTFLDRETARVVAEEADQLLPNARNHTELFSEDVWATPSA